MLAKIAIIYDGTANLRSCYFFCALWTVRKSREIRNECEKLNKRASVIKKSMGAYHLAKKSGNFGLRSAGKAIFRKFHSEIVEYLQRYSSFSVRNGTAEISLPFAKLSSFQSLISRKQWREIELQMVSTISFSWFSDFGKSLTINKRSSNRIILTVSNHYLS